jgi:hypothetical protein
MMSASGATVSIRYPQQLPVCFGKAAFDDIDDVYDVSGQI